MNRIAIKGLRPLTVLIAVMLVIADTSILRGQRDDGEMVFEAPLPVRNDPISRTANLQQTQNSGQQPRSNTATQQKTGIIQAGGAQSNRTLSTGPKMGITQVGGTLSTPRTAITGTDPKRLMTNNTPARTAQSNPVQTAQAIQTPQATQTVKTNSPQGAPNSDSSVTQAGHLDPTQGITLDGIDPALQRRRVMLLPPMSTSPMDRSTPQFRGSVLGLNSGETATERLLQMQSLMRDLDQQAEELRQQNASLLARIKEKDEHILGAVREIKVARKELGLAKTDLDRTKRELQTLQDKVRTAEREHSAVLQSMGPLLQQLLESDDVSSMPPDPAE